MSEDVGTSTSIGIGFIGLKAILRARCPTSVFFDKDRLLSLVELNEILSKHRLPQVTVVSDGIDDLLNHYMLGDCFRIANANPEEDCTHIRKHFCGKASFIHEFLDAVVLHSDDYVKSRVSASLIDLKMVNNCGNNNSLDHITYVRDSVLAFTNHSSVICDIDRLTSAEIRELCILHRLECSNMSIKQLRDCLLSHLLTTSCVLRVNDGCCSYGVSPDITRYQLIQLQNALSKNIRKRPLRRLLRKINVVYKDEQSVRSLRSLLQRTISRIQKGKESELDKQYKLNNKNDYAKRLVSDVCEWPIVVPDDVKSQCVDEFKYRTSSSQLKQHVCAVCGEEKQISYFHNELIPISAKPLSVLRKPYPDVSQNPFRSNVNLDGFMLEPKGVHYNNNDVPSIRCCSVCHSSLFIMGDIPKLSYVNDMFLGEVPIELRDLSVVEEAMISRRRAKCCIIHLEEKKEKDNSKKQKNKTSKLPNRQCGVRGHFIVFPSYPERIGAVLPASMDSIVKHICVIFVGSSPPSKEWLLKKAKPLLVRREKVRKALLWLKQHNPLYSDIVINHTMLDNLEDESVAPVQIDLEPPSFDDTFVAPSHDNIRVTDIDSEKEHDIFQSVVVTDLDGKEVSSSEMTAAAFKHLKRGGDFVQIGHGAQPSNDFVDKNLFPLLYPTLYPYGCGGFEQSKRRKAVSMRIHARHLFNLADRRFQEHYSFMFAVFNVIQRHSLSHNAKIKVPKHKFNDIGNKIDMLTNAAIDSVADRAKHGDLTSANTDEEKAVVNLMRDVSLITSTISGTSSSKVTMRNEIRAMISDIGLPSFFITINPADVYNPIVKLLFGSDIDIDNMLDKDLPTYWQQSIDIARNPFVPAKFFDLYINAFVDNILGRTETDKMGILGTYKAHYGCVEAQGRGSLHCHMLVWLDGALNPQQIKDRILIDNDVDFTRALLQYIDDIVHTNVPESLISDNDIQWYKKHPPCSTRGPSVSDENYKEKEKIDTNLLVEDCQRHYHTNSCFKYNANECRFGLNEKHHVPETLVDISTGELKFRITDGMINSYCPAMLKALRCNMDIKFIGSGSTAKAILYYITDYITKSQLKAHISYAALKVAKGKFESSYEPSNDPTTVGKLLLVKCANALVAKQELSAQQVASYLLDFGDHYTNQRFRSLFWLSFEKYVDKNGGGLTGRRISSGNDNEMCVDDFEKSSTESDIDTDVVDISEYEHIVDDEDIVGIDTGEDGKCVSTANQVLDYIHRGQNISELCLWEFVAQVDKIPIKQVTEQISTSDHPKKHLGRIPNLRAMINRPHPQSTLHIFRLRDICNRLVPVPIGPRIPRRDRPAIYEKYCRLMLILFKPWRLVSDLIDGHEKWSDSLTSYQESITVKHKHVIDNFQIMHECKDSRDDHFAKRRLQIRGLTSMPLQSGDSKQHALNTQHYDDDDETELLASLEHADLIQSDKLLRDQLDVNEAIQAMLDSSLYTNEINVLTDLSPKEPHEFLGHQGYEYELDNAWETIWRKHYESRKDDWIKYNTNDLVHPSINVSTDNSETPEIVNNINNSRTHPIPPVFSSMPISTEIQTENNIATLISSKFCLNAEQDHAFNLVVNHSLTSTTSDPLKLYIAGRGGTGKSRVIDSIKKWFMDRQESDRFRLCAFTGAAAKNVEGTTLHTTLRFTTCKRKITNKIREELTAIWSSVDYLLIDEVSMLSCEFLADVSEALSLAKNDTRDFGGLSIIFAGDFCQLSPVAGTSLYTRQVDASKKPRSSLSDQQLKKLTGRLLWLQVDNVVILHQQMRQSGTSNDHFRQLLSRISTGDVTDDDFESLSERILERKLSHEVSDWLFTPVITRQNVVKDALNHKAVDTFSKKNGLNHHIYYAEDNRSKGIINNNQVRDHILNLHSGKTEHFMGKLPLVEGMPVLFIQNYDVAGGIVNGTEGVLKSIRYEVDNDNRRYAKSCVVYVPSSSCPTLPGLNEHEIVALQENLTFQVRHPITGSLITINRKQLPIVPAFAMTDYKSQGKTMPRVIVDLESCRSIQSAYVMLSRVTSLSGLLILRPFKLLRIKRDTKKDDYSLESKRLRYLNAQTMLTNNDSVLTNSYFQDLINTGDDLKTEDFERNPTRPGPPYIDHAYNR